MFFVMKKKRETRAKTPSDLDRWLVAVDDLLEGMVMSAGPNFETKRSLAEIFINKTYELLHRREQPTVH